MSEETNHGDFAARAVNGLMTYSNTQEKNSGFKGSDIDLLISKEQREAIWEQSMPILTQDNYITKLGKYLTIVSELQHARMVNKGFYETFWTIREMLLRRSLDAYNTLEETRKLKDASYERIKAYEDQYSYCQKILREHTVNFIIKQIGLIHEEGGEGSSWVRQGNKQDDKLPQHKGVAAEMADIVIRILDLCGFMGIDLGAVLVAKIGFNETRPPMHGKDA